MARRFLLAAAGDRPLLLRDLTACARTLLPAPSIRPHLLGMESSWCTHDDPVFYAERFRQWAFRQSVQKAETDHLDISQPEPSTWQALWLLYDQTLKKLLQRVEASPFVRQRTVDMN